MRDARDIYINPIELYKPFGAYAGRYHPRQVLPALDTGSRSRSGAEQPRQILPALNTGSRSRSGRNDSL